MLQPGTLINERYRIVQTIGSGGMGSVFAAHDERLGRQVALKLLRPDLAGDQRARERFLREAQIAAQLIHPNIVRTYDVGDAPVGPYLVQELLQGQTLDSLLPLPPKQAIRLTEAISDALGYIHGQGYVHCDIKPQNIMLVGAPGTEQRVVLLDFGIARVEGTATTTLIATPHYLAPELAMGSAPAASSDWYALGIVLFQMLADHPPFDGPTLHTIIEQHRTAPLPPLKIAAGGTPQEAAAFESIIRKLTAKQPDERYRSAAELQADLANLQTGAIHAMPTMVVAKQPPVAPSMPLTAAAPPAVQAVTPRPVAERHATLAAPPSAAAEAVPPPGNQRMWLLAVPLLLITLLAGTALMRDRTPDAGANTPATTSTPAAATPGTVTVPKIIYLPVTEARLELSKAGLAFVQGEAVPSDQAVDIVVNADPPPGQPVAPGTGVVVQVSAGPPPAADPPTAPQPPGDDDDDDDDEEEKKEEEKKREEEKKEKEKKEKEKKGKKD